ncbi:MAG: ATP-binding protein [Nitrosomonas sp.]|nr:ATP-binding protein [Nitrosomonas sp.]
MSLVNYWPSLDEINRCIKAEAENSSDEVLLAVHQQFPLSYSRVGPDGKVMPGSKTPATENELISYFVADAPSGSHVLPITGASGVGKSHLIRILDARLRRLPDAHRYLIIRIPKSASLRRIVELILEADPLQDPKYDGVKREFTKALADVPLHEAVIRFQAELAIVLNEYALNLRQSLAHDTSNTLLKERFAHAVDLPKLMADAETVRHFTEKVFPRIIQRSVRGVAAEVGEMKEIDPTDSQFKEDDLDLSGIDLGQANKQVARYCQLNLNAQEGRGKSVAVSVLNEVVDKATRQLYQLNQSLGGMTLAEVILEIRRLLLIGNRELVILVEDFAALVGIQDTLAKVLIQEGETSKGKEFATIRSAIAVTDGYLAGRDTLATRAGREWVVESQLESEAETLRRIKALVASYLNAARHGETTLKKYYQQANITDESGNLLWSPGVYSDGSDEDNKTLNAFGYIENVPLFPFTEAAIEFLARITLTSGNVLIFNPRYVIKNIIREVLMVGRDAFVNGQFPPPGIKTRRASADVAQWLASLHETEDRKNRYERLVTIWGNDPKTRSEIGCIPKEVFEIFGLPQPDIDYIPPISNPIDTTEKTTETTTHETTSDQEQKIHAYKTALEEWVQDGKRLDQKVANEIRKALATLINQRIDWNAERCLKLNEIKPNTFSIPNAGGEGNVSANAIKIAMSSDDPDGRLRGELLALLRYIEVYKCSTGYEGMDEDLARISNLVERLMSDALEIVRTSVKKHNQSAILILAANSRLLGISERGSTPAALSSFLFGYFEGIESVSNTAPGSFKEWLTLQNKATEIRPQLRQFLLDTNGCFQGTGKTAYGIDMVRLVEDYPRDGDSIVYDNIQGFSSELKTVLQNMSDAKVGARLNLLLQDANKIQSSIFTELGNEFDKQTLLSTFKELATTLKEMGAWSSNEIGMSPMDFMNLCEEFRAAAIKSSLSGLHEFEKKEDDDLSHTKKIMRTAKLQLSPLLTADRFLNAASKVMRAADSYAQVLESQYQGISPNEKAKELTETFDCLIADLLILKEGGK